MSTLTKSAPKTSKAVSEEKTPVKQAKKQVERDARGRLLPGSTANPNGRPPAGTDVITQFRANEKAQGVIDKLFKVANTLDQPKHHKDAMAAVKCIVERLVPSLKATEMKIGEVEDKGFVFLPTEEKPDSE